MTMNKLKTALVVGLIAASVSQAYAQGLAQTTAPTPALTPAAASTTTAAMVQRLQSLYPSTKFGEVNPTPWPGVFEVVMGTNLAYVDESGQYFMFGHFYDMKAQRDLTAERKDTLARIDFTSLPFADAMKEVRGNGSRTLAIFSDPDCPYCRRLEGDIKTLTDVTIYTFLMPIESLHPEAHAKAIAIWCAKDRVAAYHGVMWRDERPHVTDCVNPVDRNIALGEHLGITGTPTLIAADGRMLPGAASLAQIESWLGATTMGGDAQRKSLGAAQ